MPNKIPNQQDLWNRKHTANVHASFRSNSSILAFRIEKLLSQNAKILELGCGNGRDSVYLETAGFNVLATDFSEVVIEQNRKIFCNSSTKFEVLNLENAIPYPDNMFDAVYASLSLHYFLDKKTREIIKEIHRVIAVDGIFAFSCKAKDSARTDDAEIIEENVYVDKNGHALHIFTKEYTQDVLNGLFDIEEIVESEEVYAGRFSTIIYCLARRK